MAKKPTKKKGKAPVTIAIRIPITELVALKGRARHYVKGNLSAWLRHAGLRYIPKRGEVIETVTMPAVKAARKKKR